MAFSAYEKERILKEAFGDKTQLICSKHMYSPGGPKMPTAECKDCWFAFLFHHVAALPPTRRQEKLEELELVINMASEAEDHGNFSPDIYRHPIVEVQRDVKDSN